MAHSDETRIAILERDVQEIQRSLVELNGKLDNILDTLAQISGGRKAMLGFFAIIGGLSQSQPPS